MKVVCDNCRAVYKVPDDKLTKAVNKATCRNCGHRMLIPRPKPNADPEERTLVTAVPPTPVGAPPRAASRREDDRESTLPGRQPDDVRMATPMMAPRIGDTVPAPEEDFDGPETRIKTAAEQTTVKPTPRPSNPGRAPASLPPQRRGATPQPAPGRSEMSRDSRSDQGSRSGQGGYAQQGGGYSGGPQYPSNPAPAYAAQPPATRRTPAPPAPRRGTPAPAPGRAEMGRSDPGRSEPGFGRAEIAPRATPAPAQRSMNPGGPVSYGSSVHDPAGDLNWALLGTCLALMGGVFLSILSIFNHALIMWFGLAMTFGGGILSFLVLLTGARGRRPAQTLLSVVLGFLISVSLASLLVGTKWGAEKVIDAYDIHFAPPPDSAFAAQPPPPVPVAGAPAPAAGADATAGGAVTPVPDEEVVIVPNPAPGAKPAPAPKPGKAKSGRPEPAPAPAPQPVVAQPPPAPPPAPAGLAAVPMEVVHTIVSNNIEVKRCFVPLFQSGALPPRVDVAFQIDPAGKAGNTMVTNAQYRGSQLESCLVRAIGALRFPPASGYTPVNYPFILQ
jgi:predicted Zn finger-like uncharacterized protein